MEHSCRTALRCKFRHNLPLKNIHNMMHSCMLKLMILRNEILLTLKIYRRHRVSILANKCIKGIALHSNQLGVESLCSMRLKLLSSKLNIFIPQLNIMCKPCLEVHAKEKTCMAAKLKFRIFKDIHLL